jgi:nitroreductase
MVAPEMFQRPAAVCIDQAWAISFGMRPTAKGLYIDVGTAAQTMLLAAHSLGLGVGVVRSFSQAAVIEVLDTPRHLSPEMFVCLRYPAAYDRPACRPAGG